MDPPPPLSPDPTWTREEYFAWLEQTWSGWPRDPPPPDPAWTREAYLDWLEATWSGWPNMYDPTTGYFAWTNADWLTYVDLLSTVVDFPQWAPEPVLGNEGDGPVLPGAFQSNHPVFFQPGAPSPGSIPQWVPAPIPPPLITDALPYSPISFINMHEPTYNPDGTLFYAPEIQIPTGMVLVLDRQLLKEYLASAPVRRMADRDQFTQDIETLRNELRTRNLSLRSRELFYILFQRGIFNFRPSNYTPRPRE